MASLPITLPTAGVGYSGSLGDGGFAYGPQTSPIAVAGGLSFATVSVGVAHSCGVTTTGAAYCWGNDIYGMLGDGDTLSKASPVAVAGGLSFLTVSAGSFHVCGITTVGAAYCWGANVNGELGNGSTGPELCLSYYPCSTTPVAVLGGLAFTTVSVGGGEADSYACGITTGGAAYCWGSNMHGQLGDGTTTNRTSPVPVSGGLKFATVSAALDASGRYSHTCGVTTEGATYCWGSNSKGQLGDGTTTNRSVPVKVVSQQ